MDVDGILRLANEVRAAKLPSPATARRIREEAGVSIRDAAKALDVDPITVIRWEHSRTKPRREHARRWRELLDALEGATK
jgi:transcriptional regulator with XRE-family HTH domain